MRTRTDGLRARLARLEKLAGRGACSICRFDRRHTWHSAAEPRPTDPSLILVVPCYACGAPVNHDLSAWPESLRGVVRLLHSSRPDDFFTDPRAWAALEWSFHHGEAQARSREVLREMRKLSAPEMSYHLQQRQYHERQKLRRERERARQKDPDAKFYSELLAEVQTLNRRLRRRLQVRHGKNPFPELEARLNDIRRPDYECLCDGDADRRGLTFSPMSEIRQEAESWLKCAELERVILGEASATTAGRLADCERRAREAIAVSRAKYEAREEERRREAAESERRWQESLAASSRPKPAPPSPPASPAPKPPPPAPAPQSPSPTPIVGAPADPEKAARWKRTGRWEPSPEGWVRRN